MDRKRLTEEQVKIIESVISQFEKLGIRVMAEFLGTEFHIVIPADEIAEYFKRNIKPSYGLVLDANTVIINGKAYLDVKIWRK